jgi:hypothetical protein
MPQHGVAPMIAERRSAVLTEAPEWFLAAAGFIYATGFLVVFTFFARLGIREVGTEFFKVKYVHVGILCLILPALTGLSMFALSYMSRFEAQKRIEGQVADIQIYLPSAVLTLNLIATFYIYVMFSPGGFFRNRAHLIPLIFLVTLIGLTVIQQLTRREFVVFVGRRADKIKRFSASPHTIGSFLRWLLCLLVIFFLDRYSFHGLGGELWEMFSGNMRFTSGGGYVFLVFVFLILWLFWRISLRSSSITDQKLKAALWASGISLMFATFYICILSFSYSVYPYIPAERGGGSYVDSANVVLTFQGGSNALPVGLLESASRSRPLLIIEETGTSIYVADPKDAGGPVEWRRGARPNVIAIRRDLVSSIEYKVP